MSDTPSDPEWDEMTRFLNEENMVDHTRNDAQADLFKRKMDDSETDPGGLGQHTPGAKLDKGKVRPGLVLGGFARALLRVSDVGTGGAIKYTDNGWMEVVDGEARYDDAKLRHWLTEKTGEPLDPDTKIEHAAHEAWNSLARLELMLREKEALGE
jgi:hypothetical protein